jgi:hypothetical protein
MGGIKMFVAGALGAVVLSGAGPTIAAAPAGLAPSYSPSQAEARAIGIEGWLVPTFE